MYSGRRRMRPAVDSSARSASCVRRSRSGFKTSPTTSADWCFWSAPPPHDRSSPSTHPPDRQEAKKVLPAPAKPRRNHKTSASMARPSLTGVFFEVPLIPDLGTDLPKVNPETYRKARVQEGARPLLEVPAIKPDVAMFHGQQADEDGNVQYFGAG